MSELEMLKELKRILSIYADNENYYISERDCVVVVNGNSTEKFYEFSGTSEAAKEGLVIVEKLIINKGEN